MDVPAISRRNHMQNSKVHFKEKKHQDLSNASITIKKKKN